MSDFKETCIWMSYRYAIGRKSIASVMHAEDIAKHMDWVPMDRWAFTGMDILREVNDRIGWYKNIHVESYGDPTIDIFSVIFQWFTDNPQKDEIEYFVKHEWYVDVVNGIVVRVEERTLFFTCASSWLKQIINLPYNHKTTQLCSESSSSSFSVSMSSAQSAAAIVPGVNNHTSSINHYISCNTFQAT